MLFGRKKPPSAKKEKKDRDSEDEEMVVCIGYCQYGKNVIALPRANLYTFFFSKKKVEGYNITLKRSRVTALFGMKLFAGEQAMTFQVLHLRCYLP